MDGENTGKAHRDEIGGPGSRSHELLDHTADLAVRVAGESVLDLVLASVEALAETLGVLALLETLAAGQGAGEVGDPLIARGEGDEELLVETLNEWLYHLQHRRMLFAPLGLERERGGLRLSGRWRRLPEGFALESEVKAVTYHGLALTVEQGDSPAFRATWIADL